MATKLEFQRIRTPMQSIIGGGGQGAQKTTAAAPGAVIKDTDTRAFKIDVIDESMKVPVIVDFWAPWCGPCKQLGPLLERLVKAARGAVKLVKLNVDENQQLAAQFRIQSIPAVYAFKGGRPVDGFVGALPESQLKAFIDRLVRGAGAAGPAPGDGAADQALVTAKEALKTGDAATAASLFARILDEDPENATAKLGLARAAVALGEVEQAKAMVTELPADARKGADYDAVQAALDLAQRAKKAGNLGELEDKIARNANDHQARYDMAMGLYAGGHAEAAIEHLLEIVRRSRTWNEDSARKELVKIFDALGPTHALTLKGRRSLSSILFS